MNDNHPPFETSPALQEIRAIAHGFFGRRGGVSDGLYASLNCGIGSKDDTAKVSENRARACAVLGLTPGDMARAWQVHSPRAAIVDTPTAPGEAPQVDALVTSTPGLALSVLTADCGPVLFADPAGKAIAVAHAGWKGALGGVLENTVTAMERLGAARGDIRACVGPTISQDSYEVGPEFRETFLEADADTAGFFAPSPDPERAAHWHFDLPSYILMRLERAGVGHAHALNLCTYANHQDYFSYRRATHEDAPDYGRAITAIAITQG